MPSTSRGFDNLFYLKGTIIDTIQLWVITAIGGPGVGGAPRLLPDDALGEGPHPSAWGDEQGPRGWCLIRIVGKPQEEGMMSTTVNLPLVMIPRFNRPVGERNHFRRLLLADFGNGARRSLWGHDVCASSNVEPAHNTTKILCSNLQWGYQSHWFANNKWLNVSCGRWYLFAVNK
jgi:hypothetical protein